MNNNEISTDEKLRDLDRDNAGRHLSARGQLVMDAIFIAYAVFILVMTLLVKTATPHTRLPLFLGLSLFVGYLKYPVSKKPGPWHKGVPFYDIILGVLSLAVFGYYVLFQEKIIFMGGQIGTAEIVIGAVGILLLVELTRRATGIPILCVAGAFVVYAVYWLFSRNPKTLFVRLINGLFYDLNCGIFSSPISVCASFIVLFIILGSFLEKSGIGAFFVDLANSLVGTSSGGPAKVAVIASALTGMYSGSSVANTVSSGSITIPTMKKTGYRPEFAAAVEAAASTGGQIMPPIMGAAAFLMAEITGYSYFEIVIAAILPAALYYTGIFLMVHFEAKRLGLKGLPKEAVPKFFKLIASNGYLLLPVVILIVCMNFFTSGMSAAFAIMSALIVCLVDKNLLRKLFHGERISLTEVFLLLAPVLCVAALLVMWLVCGVDMGLAVFLTMALAVAFSFFTKDAILKPATVAEGLKGGTNSSLGVIAACGVAGIVSGVVSMTALGSTLISLILPLAQNGPIFALILTMLCCIVLGMGVPTTANYVIMATITAPILIKMGIPLLAAHMFVFYFGIVADITPPVALAAYAGSAIAGSNPLKTGVQATKLAIAAFIIPYIFALNPAMLFIDTTVFDVVLIIVTSVVGMFGVSVGMQGYLKGKVLLPLRLLVIAGGLLLIYPGLVTDLIGLVVVGGVTVYQYLVVGKREHTDTGAQA